MWFRFASLVSVAAVTMLALPGAQAQSLLDIHKDAGVPCSACHSEEPPSAAPPPEICVACHGTMLESKEEGEAPKPDPHLALQVEAGEILPCTTCHSVHGETD